MPQLVLAVDVGGTRTRAALVDQSGRILHREARATPADAGAMPVVEVIAQACRAVLAAADAPADLPVGLCAPGPLDARRGIALATPTISGFTDFPLRQAVSDALGLAVTIENDGPAAALGEWQFGAGRGAQDFVYITISTGIGGGIIAGNRLLRGRLGVAGHVGHIMTRPGGAMCFCGQPGHWEAEASGSALQRKARAAGFADLQAVFDLARQGDAAAGRIVDAAAEDLGLGLISVIHMLSPERVVLGGGVSQAFDLLHPRLRARLDRQLLAPFRGVELRQAELGDDCGLLGAALLALRPDLRA